MFKEIYKCSFCNGNGRIERWAINREKDRMINKIFEVFRTKTCDSCIGTGINFNKMANFIISKPNW